MCAPVAFAPLLRAFASDDLVPLDSGLNPGGAAFFHLAVRLPSLPALTRRIGHVRAAVEGRAVVDLSVISEASVQPDWLVLSLKVESLKSATGTPPRALLNTIAATYRSAGRAPRRRRR